MARKFKVWVERDEYGEMPELSEQQVKRLKEKAFNYCVFFLSKSDKTRKELTDKLVRKNCPEEIIDEVLADLEERKFLNDHDFADSFTRMRKDSARGDSYIRMQLRRRGVDQQVIEEVLSDNADPDSDFENALEFGRRQWRSLLRYPDERDKRNRLVKKIAARGYDFDIANQVFNQLWEEDEENQED